VNTETKVIITMKIKKNNAPDALPGLLVKTIPDVKVTYGFSFPISYKSFKDVEGDEIVFDCGKRE